AGRLRPWHQADGMFLGAACATKWSGLYFLAGFGLLAAFWELGAVRAAGVRRPFLDVLRRRTLPTSAYLLAVPALVYTVSWTGWFLGDAQTAYGHDKYVQPDQGPVAHAWAVFRGWLGYHAEAYRFHVGLDSSHPYKSQPWGWLLLLRPVSYFYTSPDGSCGADACAREVLGVGTPVIWWCSIPLIVALLWFWLAHRDWRAGAVLAGIAATLLPWFATPDRTMFLFYALPAVPFFALGYALWAHWLLGGRQAGRERRATGTVLVATFAVLVVVNFFYLYPVLAAKVLPYGEWQQRMVFRECTAAGKNVQKAPCWI
ncbi:MAG: phospholipid carrier-dependent glycosyltransferase, partial [Actinomycetota bacterium]|nr:phospholipid carrier-dependent glycosyltransferase [Actinomycetota bacterium]